MRSKEEASFLENESPGLPLLGVLPADLAVQEADRLGIAVYDYVPALRHSADEMANKLVDALVIS